MDRTAAFEESARTWPAVAGKATIPKCCIVYPLATPAADNTARCDALSPLDVLKATITVPALAESPRPDSFEDNDGPRVAGHAAIAVSRPSRIARAQNVCPMRSESVCEFLKVLICLSSPQRAPPPGCWVSNISPGGRPVSVLCKHLVAVVLYTISTKWTQSASNCFKKNRSAATGAPT